MQIQCKNRKEDLKLLVDLGNDYESGVRFRLVFTSGIKGTSYTCELDENAQYKNCEMVDDKRVMCLLDNHNLPCGRVYVEVYIWLIDDQMPDGDFRLVSKMPVVWNDDNGNEYGLLLTEGKSSYYPLSEVTIQMLQSVVKGKAATIKIVGLSFVDSIDDAEVVNVGTDTDVQLNMKLPKGKDADIVGALNATQSALNAVVRMNDALAIAEAATEEMRTTIQITDDKLKDVDSKLSELNSAKKNTELATEEAKAAAKKALEAEGKVANATKNVQTAINNALLATQNAATAANLASDAAQIATNGEFTRTQLENARNEAERLRDLAEQERQIKEEERQAKFADNEALREAQFNMKEADRDRLMSQLKEQADAVGNVDEKVNASITTLENAAAQSIAETGQNASEAIQNVVQSTESSIQSIKQNADSTIKDVTEKSEKAIDDVKEEALKVTDSVTSLALKLGKDAAELKSAADKAVEDAAKAIEDVEQIDAEIVEHYLVVTDRNGDKHKIDLYEALKSVTIPLINTDVEGYMRVSGVSDPSLSYRQFPKSEFGRSVFSIFYPCLIGNNFTGRVGEILHILDKLNYERDIEGNARKIDGSEGEVLITNIKSYWAIHGRYKIDGVEYDIFMESLNPFTFHGIEAIEVKPFGWSPDYCVSHKDADNVTRMHSVYNPAWAGSYSAPIGIVGRYNYTTDANGNIVEQFDSAGLINGNANGNHTTDIALYTCEQYAMNINTDKTKTVPFMNQTARGAELLWANMLAETGTFDAHKEALMGSGYCCDYSANAAAHWEASYDGARNGIRYVAADGTTKYTTFGYFTALQNQVFGLNINCMAQMINQYRSPWKCMERHRVIAYAIDNKIAELTWFAFEGNQYKWRSVPGIAGPEQGEMTCVLWKIMSSQLASGTIDPTDGATSVAGNRIDYLVSTALYHGMVTDVSPSWWTSGLIFNQYSDGTYKAYMQRDQKKLIISENGTIDESASFNFETRYKQVGDVYDKAEGYRKNYCNDAFMLPDTNANLKGAALHTYVGAYNWFTGTTPAVGKKASRGFRRGSYAYRPGLSPLALGGVVAPSVTYSNYAFGICCEIEISGS